MADFNVVVTGVDSNGRSALVGTGPPAVHHDFVHLPGQSISVVWRTSGSEVRPLPGLVGGPLAGGVIPSPGETVLVVVTLPPAAVLASDDLDQKALAEERMSVAPDLFSRFEVSNPGFHQTPTIDYVVVLAGELWLELDDESRTALGPGDVVVQNGTRHAWRNPGTTPATFACVLVGVAGSDYP